MNENVSLLRFVRDNLPILMFVFLALIVAGAWVIFESARNLLRRDELDRLRRRVDELERDQSLRRNPAPALHITRDPMVLPTRWVAPGNAATTSDGGCLLLVDEIPAAALAAVVTVRIDGVAARLRQPLAPGQLIELHGRLGTYTVQAGAIAPQRVQLSAWLRSRHQETTPAAPHQEPDPPDPHRAHPHQAPQPPSKSA